MKKITKFFVWGSIVSVFVLIVFFTIIFANSQAQPTTSQQDIALEKAITPQHDVALEKAIEHAQTRGLNRPPTGIIAKKTTLSEWFSIVDFQAGDGAVQAGLDPDRAIWIVSMTGNVNWSGPGRQSGGSGDTFDNISIALSTDKFEYIGSFSAGIDENLPLGLER